MRKKTEDGLAAVQGWVGNKGRGHNRKKQNAGNRE